MGGLMTEELAMNIEGHRGEYVSEFNSSKRYRR